MIYFIQAGKDGPIKVGCTGNNLALRLAHLQLSSPEKLVVLGCIDGDVEHERKIHNELEKFKRSGEWYNPNIEVFEYVFDVIKKGTSVGKKSFRLHEYLRELEKAHVENALNLMNWNMTRSARFLGITFRQIRHKVQKFAIKK